MGAIIAAAILLRQIKSAMRESEIQIYSMGIFDPLDQRKRTPEEKNGPELLGELSQESGGQYFSIDDCTTLPSISARIGEELRSQYLLGYSPATGSGTASTARSSRAGSPVAQAHGAGSALPPRLLRARH